MNRANVELHIEELVLHGFSPGDRYRIAGAVEVELARLIAEQGLSPQFVHSAEVDRIDAGGFEMAPDSRGEAVGGQIAQSVHGGLARERAPDRSGMRVSR
jgi:hypothetical protein